MQYETVAPAAGVPAPQPFAAAFDALEDGVALFDAERRLVFANAALRRAAAAADGLALGAAVLDVPEASDRAALARALTAALAAMEGRMGLLPAAGLVALRRAPGRPPWIVRAVPVRCPPGDAGFRGAMLLICDAGRRRALPAASLARLFGLTPAQAALAAALAAGATLDQHARKRGISKETARSHLAEVRRRTGCRRQVDLVALLARVPG